MKRCTKKYCIRCKKTKLTKSFPRDCSRKDLLSPYCRVCRSADSKAYRERGYARDAKKSSTRLWYRTMRTKIFIHFGGKCARCGFSDTRALQVDHVNGGGHKELRTVYQNDYFKMVLSDTTGKYQLLCANCNCIKRIENHEMSVRRNV